VNKATATVAAGHPLVAEIAFKTLRRGGNAFDAAIAGGFAACVAEPLLSSLGGGGFLLARTAAGRETLFDFFVDTPGLGLDASLKPNFFPITVNFAGSPQEFNIGLGSVAVPGNLQGFLHIHSQLGRLPLGEIVAPAVALASRGVLLNRYQAYVFSLLRPVLTLTREGRQLFEPAGRQLVEGDRFLNPLLAEFLTELSGKPAKIFSHGDLAPMIDADMRQGHGLLTAADLIAYKVIERQPLEIAYRKRRLLTNPPPSFGGALIAGMLRLLANFPLAEYAWGSPPHLLTLAGVMAEVERQRATNVDLDGKGVHTWAEKATGRIRRFSRGTTHISIVDLEGNVAAMTTSNGEGSGYLVPGTGIMLNNMMGEDDLHPEGFHAHPPGQRVASMMSPTLLVRDGQLELALGSGGSKRIRSAIVQVISNVIDFGMEIGPAVTAPRLHWDGAALQLEPGYPPAAVASLRQQWPVNLWPSLEIYFGGVNAVVKDGGAGDPRRGGAAVSSGELAETG
jgi:gamma-glutamyltranspeptidase / glutathione hydrolase